jgi:hypothetical protein
VLAIFGFPAKMVINYPLLRKMILNAHPTHLPADERRAVTVRLVDFNRKARYLVFFTCLVSIPAAQAQQSHEHGHAAHGVMQIELDHGRRWATDAPLREGMERVRAVVATARQANARGRLNATQAQALAAGVEEGIAFMVQHCRLEPKADANLHILLGRLSAAATAVKANPKAADGLPQMLEVLELYPRTFTHPGWKGVAHGH